MSKAVKVTNADATNSARVTWTTTPIGPTHEVMLAPGESKTIDPIGGIGGASNVVKVYSVAGPVTVMVDDLNGDLAVVERTDHSLHPGGAASYTVDADYLAIS